MILNYIKGNAVYPIHDDYAFILQINNDKGYYGKGFSGALAQRWPQVKKEYRSWSNQDSFLPGEIQILSVESNISVINMIAQHGISYNPKKNPPIRYDWLDSCLIKAASAILNKQGSVHAPKIGTGNAGGDWRKIEAMLKKAFIEKGIDVTIYNPY